ncbi:hypothetical protein [Actinoplanes awajinensis]|uniref:hypothetical protein n=1 Tax=Actinoplanes awajinensis TaxID=135946 RepID=UPI000A56231A|nr:hypothetical protein [Actinoplanes awajinensis]
MPEPAATLAAEAGIVVLRVAFERWVEAGVAGDLGAIMRETLADLRAVTVVPAR